MARERLLIGIDPGEQRGTNKVEHVINAGAQIVRINFTDDFSTDVSYGVIEQYDNLIALYRNSGIQIVGTVGAESAGGYDRTNPGEFIPRLVEAADKITNLFSLDAFEIFNEPNDWYGGEEAQVHPWWYATMVQSVKDRMNENGKTPVLISGPLFGHDLSNGANVGGDSGADYLRSVYEYGEGTLGWTQDTMPFDMVGYHLYVAQASNQPDIIKAVMQQNIQAIKEVTTEHHPGALIGVTECGWQTREGALSEEDQAQALYAAHEVFLGDDTIAYWMWFSLRDFWGGDGQAYNYGLERVEADPKLSYTVFQAIEKQ